MTMPEMNGKDIFKEMIQLNPEIKAILMSGYDTDKEVYELLQMGIKDFLRKPFSRDDLLKKITTVLHD